MRQRQGAEAPKDDAESCEIDAERFTPRHERRECDADRHDRGGQSRDGEADPRRGGTCDVDEMAGRVKRAEVEREGRKNRQVRECHDNDAEFSNEERRVETR